MGHVQHLSIESLVKMDHFQKEPPLNLKGTTGAQGGRKGPVPKGTDREIPLRLNVRFGSKAGQTIPEPKSTVVRLGPKADRRGRCPIVRFVPIADIQGNRGSIWCWTLNFNVVAHRGRPVAFAYAFATFFRSGLPLIASRANRSARSLAVSRRVACSLLPCSERAFTPSCFHRNRRSARSFFIEVIEGMIDNALLKIIKPTAPSSTEPEPRLTTPGHYKWGTQGMPGLELRYR